MKEINSADFEKEVLTATQKLNEYIMTSLRTMEGLSPETITLTYGLESSNKIIRESQPFLQTGKMQIINGNLVLTKEGKLFADGIAAALFF